MLVPRISFIASVAALCHTLTSGWELATFYPTKVKLDKASTRTNFLIFNQQSNDSTFNPWGIIANTPKCHKINLQSVFGVRCFPFPTHSLPACSLVCFVRCKINSNMFTLTPISNPRFIWKVLALILSSEGDVHHVLASWIIQWPTLELCG